MRGDQALSDDYRAVDLTTKGLDQVLKALKGPLPVARVGVLGGRNAREGKVSSNATVGAAHEFGTEHLPMRSFLRVPLMENLDKYLRKSQAFDKDVLKKVIATGTITEWLRKVAISAEAVVADAFNSGGFGKWPPSNMRYKKNHQTLIETQQLRNSITSDVKE